MKAKYEVIVTSVGNLARTFLQNNNSAIILDEGLRPNLSDMVIEHTIGNLNQDIKVGDRLQIDAVDFKVISVGQTANDDIREEGHCTLVFNAEGSMPGQIIVSGEKKPIVTIGSKIAFCGK